MSTAKGSEIIREVSRSLSSEQRTLFIVAAMTRVLPVYQIYDEMHGSIRGHAAAWDALGGMVALPLRRRFATPEKVSQKIQYAVTCVAKDVDRVEGGEDFGVTEELVQEVMQTLLLVFGEWRTPGVDMCLQVGNSAMEVDSIWAENCDDPAVDWNGVEEHFQCLVRDLRDLTEVRSDAAVDVYRMIYARAVHEALPYLNRMKEVLVKKRA